MPVCSRSRGGDFLVRYGTEYLSVFSGLYLYLHYLVVELSAKFLSLLKLFFFFFSLPIFS